MISTGKFSIQPNSYKLQKWLLRIYYAGYSGFNRGAGGELRSLKSSYIVLRCRASRAQRNSARAKLSLAATRSPLRYCAARARCAACLRFLAASALGVSPAATMARRVNSAFAPCCQQTVKPFVAGFLHGPPPLMELAEHRLPCFWT